MIRLREMGTCLSIRKRDELKIRKTLRVFCDMKNYFSTLSSGIYNWRTELKEYEQQKHLKKVVREYRDAVQKSNCSSQGLVQHYHP